MKVYIVFRDRLYEDSEILGVFINKEDAEKTKKDAEISMSNIILKENELIE
jgi:hypothetical protein